FAHEGIATPLGLSELRLGIPPSEYGRMADIIHVGEALTAEEMRKLGLPPMPETEVTETAINGFNDPVVRESGVPGGGGIMTAGELALFYQGLLHNPPVANGSPIWQSETFPDALRVSSG